MISTATWVAWLDLFVYRFRIRLCEDEGKNLLHAAEHPSTCFYCMKSQFTCCCFYSSIQHFSITKLTLDFVLKRERKTNFLLQTVSEQIEISSKASKANDFSLNNLPFSITLRCSWESFQCNGKTSSICWAIFHREALYEFVSRMLSLHCEWEQVSSIKSELI